MGDKLWKEKPHPLNAAAASLESLLTGVVGALEAVDEAALRTRGGKLAIAALKSAPSPLEAEGDSGGSIGADSWQTQAGKWFVSAISTPLGELLERAAYMFEVLLSEKCEVIALAPTEQQLREAVNTAAAKVKGDLESDAASTKQVAVADAFRRLLGVPYISAVGQTASDSVQSVTYPEFSYNYARVLTVDRGLRRVLDMIFDETVLRLLEPDNRTSMKERANKLMFHAELSEEGEPPEPPVTAQELKVPAEAAGLAPEDAGSSAAVLERVAELEAKDQQDAMELAPKVETKTAGDPEPQSVDGTVPTEPKPEPEPQREPESELGPEPLDVPVQNESAGDET